MRSRTSRGFTLIEILVALVVLSIGLLGVAALQITSKRGNHEAMQRVTAIMLAEDIIDRIRQNPTRGGTYSNGPSGGGVQTRVLTGGTVLVDPVCGTTCDASEIADTDLFQWQEGLVGANTGADQGGLVSPTGCISGPITGDAGIYTVAIAWRGMTEINDPGTSTCGQDSGLYDADAVNDDPHRRVLTTTFYLAAD